MRKVALLAVFALVASDVATADVVRHGSIPEAYRGTWMADAGTEPEKSVIVLSAKMYVSREASCSVNWVSQTAGARGSIYSAHLRCFNPADRAGKKTVSNLIIWPHDINQIAAGPDFTKLAIFHRCSAARQLPPDFESGELSNADCGLKVRGEGATVEPTPQGDRS
jgi:hypothetical protein